MERKPDMIRIVVILFAIGLVVTGFSSIQTKQGDSSTADATPQVSFLSQLLD